MTAKRRSTTKPKPRAQWRFELSYHLVMISTNPETPAELLGIVEKLLPSIAGRVMRSSSWLLNRRQKAPPS